MEFTPNINLYKPSPLDQVEVHTSLKENFEKIDASIGASNQQLAETVPYKKTVGETYSSQSIQNFINNHEFTRIKKDDYLLDNVIKIPSNRFIFVEHGATFTLKAGANKYIFENEDTVNGNENITVIGGNYYGNGLTMGRIYGTTLQNSYYGFGFHFHKVKNLQVEKLKLYQTRGWAIAHMNCDGVVFRDIEVWQDASIGNNGDGITGQSNNVTIENIKGYTNDDLVAPLAYGAQMDVNELHYEPIDTANWYINNITACKHPTANNYTHRAVACYARLGKTISNLNISNVFGTSYSSLVKVSGHASADGFFHNVNISNVSGTTITSNEAILDVGNTRVSTLTVKGISRVEGTINSAAIIIKENGYVEQFILSDVNLKWLNSTDGQVIFCKGIIENLILDNIISLDANGALRKVLFRNDAIGVTPVTNIRASKVFLTLPDLQPFIFNNGAKARLNTSDLKVDKAIFTANDKDILLDKTLGLVTYDSGQSVWVPAHKSLVDFHYTTSDTTFAVTNTYTKIPFNVLKFDTNSTWSIANANFVAPATAYYSVIGALGLAQQTVDNVIYLAVHINGVKSFILGCANINTGKVGMVNGSVNMRLQKGDTVDIRAYADSATTIVNNSNSALISYVNVLSLH